MRNLIILVTFAMLPIAVNAKYDREAVPPARPIGKPVSCIPNSRISETRVHGDQVIDFIVDINKVYRNTLPMSCPSLGFEERFGYTLHTDELCSVDTITVLQSPGLSRGVTCGLGEFQPVELIKEPKK